MKKYICLMLLLSLKVTVKVQAPKDATKKDTALKNAFAYI
jgi:hypothetical protein